MSFDDRIAKASAFEKQLFSKIEKMGFVVAINGTEHILPGFTDGLRKSTDQTSLAIRFQPDGVARIGIVPRSFYVEAKASKSIEKTAYEQYNKLRDAGNIVVIVFQPLNWKWCFVDEMPLEDGNITASRYAEDRRFPVDDEGWLCPRKSKHGTQRGSGTPYRLLIESELIEWSKFRTKIIERLGQ